MTVFIFSVVLGILIGILLGVAGKVFAVETDERVEKVRECLPGNNCGGCGYPGCDGLAEAIVAGDAPVNGCPVGGAPVAGKIAEILGVEAGSSEKQVAFVKCAGTCEKANQDYEYTLSIQNGVAKVDRDKCVACGQCVATCPNHVIDLIPYSSAYAVQCSSKDKGKAVMEVCQSGCIGCGLCVRQCEFGAVTLEDNIAVIDGTKCQGCGKCAEKCPKKVIHAQQ